MDAADLSKLFLFVAVLVGFGRFVVVSLNQAENGFASLFVPPDRNLGWPRGVQESDDPWGWRPGLPTEVFASPDVPAAETERSTPVDGIARAGSFVIPVRRVAPIWLKLRRH